MKKILIWVGVFLCLCGTGCAGMAAETVSEVQGQGLDVVILLDCSNSMSGKDAEKPSDPEYYRLDAACMMINMCDVENTRLAIVPFAGTILDKPMCNEFVSLSSMRDQLCATVMQELRTVQGGTNITLAFQKAESLLEQARAEGSRNQQVILLLCDGQLSVTNEYAQKNGFSDAKAAKTALQTQSITIAERIRNSGGYIYAIGLKVDSNVSDRVEDLFMYDLVGTDFSNRYKSVSNPEQLPDFFSEVFADAIGSKPRPETGQNVEDSGRIYYEITLQIPNNSVLEANIVIPDSYVRDGEVKVYAPGANGVASDVPVTDKDRILFSHFDNGRPGIYHIQSRFHMLKIRRPSAGTWKVRFLRSDTIIPSDFTFDILYNYDVQLEAEGKAQYYRNDHLDIHAYFVDNTGLPTEDLEMYRHGIYASVDLMRDGEVIARKENLSTERDEQEGFFFRESLRELGLDGSGTYQINIRASGDELLREIASPIEFEVVNRAPALTNQDAGAQQVVLQIEDLMQEDPYQEVRYTLNFTELVTDADGDPLRLVLPETEDTLCRYSVDGLTLRITSQGQSGSEEILVKAEDDEGLFVEVPLAVAVRSLRSELREHYAVTAQVEDGEVHSKNEPVEITLRLHSEVDVYPELSQIASLMEASLSGTITLRETEVSTEEGEQAEGGPEVLQIEPIPLQYDAQRQCMTATLQTIDSASEYTLEIVSAMKDLSFPEQRVAFSVGNTPPEPVQEYIQGLDGSFSIDPIPYLPATQERTIDLSQAFNDREGDIQRYEIHVADDTLMQFTLEDGDGGSRLKLQALGAGDTQVTVRAVDIDGESGDFALQVSVQSILGTVLFYILCVVAVIAVIVLIALLIYWRIIRKPWSGVKQGTTVTVFLNNTANKGSVKLPRKKRNDRALRSFGAVDSSFIEAKEKALMRNALQNIMVRPQGGNTLQVFQGKKYRKKVNGKIEVRVGAKQLTRQNPSGTWSASGNVTITMGTSTVEYRRQ